MTEPKLVWKGEGYQEPIRGQEASLFWASDGEVAYKARSVVLYSCGKCGRGLAEEGRWPRKCSLGHVNYPRV